LVEGIDIGDPDDAGVALLLSCAIDEEIARDGGEPGAVRANAVVFLSRVFRERFEKGLVDEAFDIVIGQIRPDARPTAFSFDDETAPQSARDVVDVMTKNASQRVFLTASKTVKKRSVGLEHATTLITEGRAGIFRCGSDRPRLIFGRIGSQP